eukprot:88054-Pyramimonas_sp.AAC.1
MARRRLVGTLGTQPALPDRGVGAVWTDGPPSELARLPVGVRVVPERARFAVEAMRHDLQPA